MFISRRELNFIRSDIKELQKSTYELHTLIRAVGLKWIPPPTGQLQTRTVTRKGQDLYRVDGTSVYIVTWYCYEYVYSEEAVLKYEQYSYDNKLVFDSGTTCDVEKLVN